MIRRLYDKDKFNITFLVNELSLIKSVAYLGAAQIVNFISPLLITPYLIRLIGIENFGIVTLAQVIMGFVMVLTEYGFNLTSTQSASINRDDSHVLSTLYNDVTTTRFCLVIFGFFTILLLTLIVPTLKEYQVLFLLSYTMVIGRSMIPSWLLIGMDKSQIVTVLNVISRITSYVLIYLFVRQAYDFVYINIAWGVGESVSGLCCLWYIRKNYGINVRINFRFATIVAQLKKGWAVFLTNGMNALYMNSGIIVLSIFASAYTLGMYAIAEKIMLLVKQVFAVVAQATYPHACRLALVSRERFSQFLTIEFYGCFVVFFSFGLATVIGAEEIINLFVGKPEPEAVQILKIIAFVPLIVSLNLPAYHVLIINDFRRSYLAIMSFATILNMSLNFALVPFFLANGTVAVVLLTEAFVTCSFHAVLYFKYPHHRFSYI